MQRLRDTVGTTLLALIALLALLPIRTIAVNNEDTVLNDGIQSDSTLQETGDIVVPYNEVEQIIGKDINALPLFRQPGVVILFSYRGSTTSAA